MIYGKKTKDRRIAEVLEQYYDSTRDITALQRGNIQTFFEKIRNVINHGGTLNSGIDIDKCIDACIRDLKDFVEG